MQFQRQSRAAPTVRLEVASVLATLITRAKFWQRSFPVWPSKKTAEEQLAVVSRSGTLFTLEKKMKIEGDSTRRRFPIGLTAFHYPTFIVRDRAHETE